MSFPLGSACRRPDSAGDDFRSGRVAGPADPAALCYVEHVAPPTVAPDVVRLPVSEPAPAGGPDAPVRIEVAMPRGLFDRLTDHDDAPRCRYDEHTGLAEFVAEPGFAHEGAASRIAELFARIADALADRGCEVSWTPAGALRLISDDGAFEADASLYLDPEAERAVRRVDGYLDVRAGLPPPDLVVEIDRSRRSGYKLAPYFRMGVKEAWTSHRKDGVDIWTPDADVAEGFRSVPASAVLPGLTAADLAPSAPVATRGSRPGIPGVSPAASPSECSMPPAPDGRREPVGEHHRAQARAASVPCTARAPLGTEREQTGQSRRCSSKPRARGPRRRSSDRGEPSSMGLVAGYCPFEPVVATPRRKCRLAQFSISVTACSTDSRAM